MTGVGKDNLQDKSSAFAIKRPVDVYFVSIPEDAEGQRKYDPRTPYRLIPASALDADPGLAGKLFGVSILHFFGGDNPDLPAGPLEVGHRLAAALQRGAEVAHDPRDAAARAADMEGGDDRRPRNEMFLRLGTDYFVYGDKSGQGARGLVGPYGAEYGVHFGVRDFRRAGGHTDRRVFDNLRIADALTLRVELQEVDEMSDGMEPYLAILKGTGLDGVLNLTGQRQIVQIATQIFTNISRLNKNDVVWDETITLTTRDAPGQSRLRPGIFVLIESTPRTYERGGDGLRTRDPHPLWIRGNVVYRAPEPEDGSEPPRTGGPELGNYLVLSVYRVREHGEPDEGRDVEERRTIIPGTRDGEDGIRVEQFALRGL